MDRNEVVLTGEVVEVDAPRFTPAGIPVTGFTFRHVSTQPEATGERRIDFRMAAVAMGDTSREAAGIRAGNLVKMRGFLADRGRGQRELVLHVNRIAIE